MDNLMPFAEIPPEGMPSATIDYRQKWSFPRLMMLPLEDHCVGLVIKFCSKKGHPRFHGRRNIAEQLIKVSLVPYLFDVQIESRRYQLQQLSERFRLPVGGYPPSQFLLAVSDEVALDIAPKRKPKAFCRCAKLVVIGVPIGLGQCFSSKKAFTPS
jgi:hypothetical protein